MLPNTGNMAGALDVLQGVRFQENRPRMPSSRAVPRGATPAAPASPAPREPQGGTLSSNHVSAGGITSTSPDMTVGFTRHLRRVQNINDDVGAKGVVMLALELHEHGFLAAPPPPKGSREYDSDLYSSDESSEDIGDEDKMKKYRQQRRWAAQNASPSPRRRTQKVAMQRPRGLPHTNTHAHSGRGTVASEGSPHRSLMSLQELTRVYGHEQREQLAHERHEAAMREVERLEREEKRRQRTEEEKQRMYRAMNDPAMKVDAAKKAQQIALGNVVEGGNVYDRINLRVATATPGSKLSKMTNTEIQFIRMFTIRRVKRIVGECCVSAAKKLVSDLVQRDLENARQMAAIALISRSYKAYRYRRFAWALMENLRVHRAQEAHMEAMEYDEYRMRMARRLVRENEFFHGVNGDNLTGPKRSPRKGQEVPAAVLSNPRYSQFLCQKSALRKSSTEWVENQAERQLEYDAAQSARYEYKQTAWDLKLKVIAEKKEAQRKADFLKPKNARKKFGEEEAGKKKKKKKKGKKKEKNGKKSKKKRGAKGPGILDFDDPKFWAHNATGIAPVAKDVWNKKWIYKDIYQGQQRPLALPATAAQLAQREKEKDAKKKAKKERKGKKTENSEGDDESSSSSSSSSESGSSSDEEPYVNENEALLKKDYLADWVRSLKTNIGGLGLMGVAGAPDLGVGAIGSLDVPRNPFEGAVIHPYTDFSRNKHARKAVHNSNLGGSDNAYDALALGLVGQTHRTETYGQLARTSLKDPQRDFHLNFHAKNVMDTRMSKEIAAVKARGDALTVQEKQARIEHIIGTYANKPAADVSRMVSVAEAPVPVQQMDGCGRVTITMADVFPGHDSGVKDYHRDVPADWEQAAHVDRDYARAHNVHQMVNYPQYNSGLDVYAYNKTYTEYLTLKVPSPGKKKMVRRKTTRKGAPSPPTGALTSMVAADKYADVSLEGCDLREEVETAEVGYGAGNEEAENYEEEEQDDGPPAIMPTLSLNPAAPPSPQDVSTVSQIVAGLSASRATLVPAAAVEAAPPEPDPLSPLANKIVRFDADFNSLVSAKRRVNDTDDPYMPSERSSDSAQDTSSDVKKLVRKLSQRGRDGNVRKKNMRRGGKENEVPETGSTTASLVSALSAAKPPNPPKTPKPGSRGKRTMRDMLFQDDSTAKQQQQQEARRKNLKFVPLVSTGGLLGNKNMQLGASSEVGNAVYNCLAPAANQVTNHHVSPFAHENVADTASSGLRMSVENASSGVDTAPHCVPMQPPAEQRPSRVAMAPRSTGVPSYRATERSGFERKIQSNVTSKVVPSEAAPEVTSVLIPNQIAEWELQARVDPSKYRQNVLEQKFDVFGSETGTGNSTTHSKVVVMPTHAEGSTYDRIYQQVISSIGGGEYAENMVVRKPACSLLSASVYNR